MTSIIIAEIGVVSDMCLRMILAHAPNHQLVVDRAVCRGIWLYSIVIGSYIGIFLSHWGWYGQLGLGVLASYLAVASIQDLESCQVYDFLHLAAAPAGLFLLLTAPSRENMGSLLLFLVIQIGIFMHMYGAADGMVFLVCAIYESRFGKGLMTYLMHMSAAFLSLAVVQGCSRNISRRGNLKKPVPFVPYIAATVWIFL